MKIIINTYPIYTMQKRINVFMLFLAVVFVCTAFDLNDSKLQEPKREVKKTGSAETKIVKRKETSLLKKSTPKKIMKQEKKAEKKQEKKDLKQEVEREEKAKK